MALGLVVRILLCPEPAAPQTALLFYFLLYVARRSVVENAQALHVVAHAAARGLKHVVIAHRRCHGGGHRPCPWQLFCFANRNDLIILGAGLHWSDGLPWWLRGLLLCSLLLDVWTLSSKPYWLTVRTTGLYHSGVVQQK